MLIENLRQDPHSVENVRAVCDLRRFAEWLCHDPTSVLQSGLNDVIP